MDGQILTRPSSRSSRSRGATASASSSRSWASRDARDALAPAILSKAEGNPFFLEELCRAVSEQPEAAVVAVPDTVEEALRARIDRLPEDMKSTLRLASVIGREIPLGLFQAVWRGPGDFEAHPSGARRGSSSCTSSRVPRSPSTSSSTP